jgi:hypothetical protein
LRQDYKVFILSLNGLADKVSADQKTGRPIPGFKLLALRLLVLLLRLLGYRQASVSEASARKRGRYYCPVIDIHNLKTLSEFNAVRSLFERATVFIAPAFMSQLTLTDRVSAWDRFRDMARSGVEMGLAGYRYINLTALRHSAQRSEISRSARVIAERTGTRPRVAAFPTGTFDATTISCCRESGITMGIGHTGLFAIEGATGHMAPRLQAAEFSLKSLASILAFNYKRSVRRRTTTARTTAGGTDEPPMNQASTGA